MPSSTEKGLGNNTVARAGAGGQCQIVQEQRTADLGDEGVVDIGDAEQEIGRALQQTHVDIGHDGQRGNNGRMAVDGHDVPCPACHLEDAGKLAVIAL